MARIRFRLSQSLLLIPLIARLGGAGVFAGEPTHSEPATTAAPTIASVVKPQLQKRLLEERDILTSATLGDADASAARRYRFYAAMHVRSSIKQAREILTDYALYAKMVPYVDKAEYTPASRILNIEGGIFGFKLISSVRFEEKGENWIRYRVVAGHFTGLSGDIVFESQGERGTAVMMRGELLGNAWPPKFVIERGAEIVFGFTAKRMRSYIESQKSEAVSRSAPKTEETEPTQPIKPIQPIKKKSDHGDREVPQPRSHL